MPDIAEIEKYLSSETSVILRLGSKIPACDTPLKSLGYNSMSLVELLLSIERRYGIQLLNKGLTEKDLGGIRNLAQRLHSELAQT